MSKIKFKNPPINELVIGVYFERDVIEFKTEHVGLFWNTIRKEFPTVRHQPILTPPITAPSTFVFEFTPDDYIPRFWFEARDGVMLIQIQRNAFLMNWRKREGEYPHFESVKAAFDRYYSMFVSFITSELATKEPKIRVAELSYINLVSPGSYWKNLKDTGLVIPSFRVPPLASESEIYPDFNQVATYKMTADLTMNVIVRSARSAKDPLQPVLIFELRSLGLLAEGAKPEADTWFERAHDAAGACFLAMTSPDIQKRHWEKH